MPAHRCRLCTANDREALIEELAEKLWDSQRGGSLDDWAWPQASPYWQRVFREFAAATVQTLAP